MLSFSPNLQEIIWPFAAAFTTPTFQNVLVLFVGAVMSPKDRTVSGMLRAAGCLAAPVSKSRTTIWQCLVFPSVRV